MASADGVASLLDAVACTASGLPAFLSKELEIVRKDGVAVYSDGHAFKSADGVARFTSHRVIWTSPAGASYGLALQTVKLPLKAEGGGFFSGGSAKFVVHAQRVVDGALVPQVVEFAFKTGGASARDEAQKAVESACAAKAWEADARAVRAAPVRRGGGIANIQRRVEAEDESANSNLGEAFSDLKGLMAKAKEMVNLSSKLTSKSKDNADIGAMLDSVGIDNPVTKDAAGSSYHKELAQEVADLLLEKKVLEKHAGLITLADLYCLCNRARGIEMVSPDDVVRACGLFKSLKIPIQLRTFESGVTIVQSAAFSDSAADEQILRVLKLSDTNSLTAQQFSTLTAEGGGGGMSLYLAKDCLLAAESRGVVARDECIEGLRFHENMFLV